jgi:hypothetical protein
MRSSHDPASSAGYEAKAWKLSLPQLCARINCCVHQYPYDGQSACFLIMSAVEMAFDVHNSITSRTSMRELSGCVERFHAPLGRRMHVGSARDGA